MIIHRATRWEESHRSFSQFRGLLIFFYFYYLLYYYFFNYLSRCLPLFLWESCSREENPSLLAGGVQDHKPLSHGALLPADLIPPRPDLRASVCAWVLSRIARGRSISRAAPACSSWVVGLISTLRESGCPLTMETGEHRLLVCKHLEEIGRWTRKRDSRASLLITSS